MIESLPVLETYYENETGLEISLPPELEALYGKLRLPARPPGRPYIASNFVATLDGVVSLNEPGFSGGGAISGFNSHDQMVMGLLRAACEIVIAGASAVRTKPGHIWTAEFIFPQLAEAYRQLRKRLRLPAQPLNVVITGQGSIDLSLPLFRLATVPVLVLTTEAGARRLARRTLPPSTRVEALQPDGPLTALEILEAIARIQPAERILLEGGPQLLGEFLAHDLLDELFLTVAPQIAGRSPLVERPGLVAGRSFAPQNPRWAQLTGLKRGGDHLFLRYSFSSGNSFPSEFVKDA